MESSRGDCRSCSGAQPDCARAGSGGLPRLGGRLTVPRRLSSVCLCLVVFFLCCAHPQNDQKEGMGAFVEKRKPAFKDN